MEHQYVSQMCPPSLEITLTNEELDNLPKQELTVDLNLEREISEKVLVINYDGKSDFKDNGIRKRKAEIIYQGDKTSAIEVTLNKYSLKKLMENKKHVSRNKNRWVDIYISNNKH